MSRPSNREVPTAASFACAIARAVIVKVIYTPPRI
jgi:hypothetical protein